MKKENLKRKRTNKKTLKISIRISPQYSKWLKDNDYSPTAILQEASKELGYKEETK